MAVRFSSEALPSRVDFRGETQNQLLRLIEHVGIRLSGHQGIELFLGASPPQHRSAMVAPLIGGVAEHAGMYDGHFLLQQREAVRLIAPHGTVESGIGHERVRNVGPDVKEGKIEPEGVPLLAKFWVGFFLG
ncbi:MAG: hypothetical protein O2868_10065 [Proteobacteria bacterium]|nr:hypothetical protein [Pseudomonadota bacterium]